MTDRAPDAQAALAPIEASRQRAEQCRGRDFRDMVKSEDFVEGPKAFTEKRPPRWKGR